MSILDDIDKNFERKHKKTLMDEESKGINDWTMDSVKKFSKKIGKTPDEKGFFDACTTRMSKHMSDEDAKGMCAKIRDKFKGSTYWRGKDKSEKERDKDTKSKQNVEKFPKD